MRTNQEHAVDLSIVIVDTNEGRVLPACLKSIYQETRKFSFEVIVVDNGSADGSGEMVRREFPQVKVVRNPANLGFAAANNRGLEHAVGKYVLLLNPDTEVMDGALDKTVAFMNATPKAGVVGCTLHYPGGTIQESVRSFPSLLNVFFESTFLYLLLRRSKTVGRYYMSFFDYRSTRIVDWLSGAFFMTRKDVVDAIGILDEQFWMYSEEVDFCWRARAAGYETWFFHDAHVVHHWGGPNVKSRKLMLWVHRSQVLFFRKHFNGAEQHLLVACKVAGLMIRIPVYGVTGILLFNKRLMEKARLFAYALAHVMEK